MSDKITITQEDIAPISVVEREILIDEQVAPIVVESPAVEIVTLEHETHVVDETPQLSIITVGEQGPPGTSSALGPPGLDGDPGEDALPIPGERGRDGADGVIGRDGLSIPGIDGNDGEDAFSIPGERGIAGLSAVLANLDGGHPDSNYGGITAIDAGGP